LCTSSFVRPSGRDLFGSGSLALPASALSKVGFLQSALSLLHWPCGDCLANEKSLTDLQNRLDLFLLIKRLGFSGCSQATRFFFSNSINRDLTSAINLLSNGDLKNQKISIFKGLRALISTFCLFPLVAENYNLTLFVYKPCDVVFVLF